MLNEKKAQRKVRELESELITILLILVSGMDTVGNRISLNQRNMRLSNLVTLFNRFNRESQLPFLGDVFKDVKNIKNELDTYYKSLGFKSFNKSHRKINTLDKSIKLYIDEFAKSTSVRLEIQGLLTGAIASNVTPSVMAKTIKNGVKGKLQKYYQRFMWDEIIQVERIKNNFYAEELELNWFIYDGGLIETSRQFCIKRNGKLFNRSDASKWRFDPTLPQPETADTYQPLIELGRFNCRHFLRWITDKQAGEMKE